MEGGGGGEDEAIGRALATTVGPWEKGGGAKDVKQAVGTKTKANHVVARAPNAAAGNVCGKRKDDSQNGARVWVCV